MQYNALCYFSSCTTGPSAISLFDSFPSRPCRAQPVWLGTAPAKRRGSSKDSSSSSSSSYIAKIDAISAQTRRKSASGEGALNLCERITVDKKVDRTASLASSSWRAAERRRRNASVSASSLS
uniref:Uncharacterized protein n=1 Tax=Trichogramma kaykai TaxID=54128 RepID=A0ABD2XGS3_9HYME